MKRLFDPRGIKPEDYKSKYPEIRDVQEFVELSAHELMFVWWYANPTSPLFGIAEDVDRCEKAFENSGFNPGKLRKEAYLKLKFDEKISKAIERMRKFEPDARWKAREMIIKIFDEYQDIISMGPGGFTDKEGDVDHDKYVKVTKNISSSLPELIRKLEEGFGMSESSKEEIEQMTGNVIRDWHQNKQRK